MKYETPELTALMPAVNAIQSIKSSDPTPLDGSNQNEVAGAYEDWE